MYNYNNLRPELKHLINDGAAAIPLTDSQRKALHRFKLRVEASDYIEISHPCLCGAIDDILVACKDRYGLPLRTVLCKKCGLMRSDPYLAPDTLKKFYRDDYRSIYDEVVPGSEALVYMINHGERICQLFKNNDITIPRHVFEVGCGIGANLIPFLLQNHIVTGCDHGVDFLEMGRKLGLDLREGGMETFGDELPHSLIILSQVLEHFWDPVSQLKLLRKKLPEGSFLYVELPGIFSIHQSYGSPLLFLQNAHAYHFCLKTLDYVMSRAGFKRIYGDEQIHAIYCLNSSFKPLKPIPELHLQVLGYLKHVSRLRRVFHFFSLFHRSARKIYKLAALHFHKLVMKVMK